jgi:replicative DNA helicase
MEQDADMILFLYRDEYYNPNSEDAGKAMVRIAKNRHGSLEDVYLAFVPHFMKFTNLQRT